MSEEQQNEETEVEAHGSGHKVDHPQKFWASDEPRDEAETDDEVEAHGASPRMSHPRKVD